MAKENSIIFIDISDREERARSQVAIDIGALEARKTKRGSLSETDQLELARLKDLKQVLDARSASKGVSIDPLFVAARALFNDPNGDLKPQVLTHSLGKLTIAPADASKEASKDKEKEARDATVGTARAALVLGLLQLRGVPLPPVRVNKKDTAVSSWEIEPVDPHENGPKFAEAFYQAIGTAAGNQALFLRVLKMIVDAVDISSDDETPKVSTLEYAKVFEKLLRQGISSDEANLKRYVDGSLDRVQGSDDQKPAHEIGINLPDLEAMVDSKAVRENIQLMGPMIFASMFDELKAFQVVDKLIEMSQRGQLALLKGKAGTRLYNYWRQAPNRMSETERQTFYAITLGLPTGPPGVAGNTEFPDLWLRFVSSVSTLVRESRVDSLIRSSLPYAINQQQVKKSARDLTSNMSLYGYGMAYYAAIDLQAQINEMIDLLQDDELRRTFGARDMWGVIDQVASTELGGARNSSKYRMLATSGAIITAWLANNLDRISDPTQPVIDLRDVDNPPARPKGQTALSNPSDYDLVNACEMWLADSAMGEDRVEALSQPRESPQQPSRPIQIPSFARDLLESSGLGMEMSAMPRNGSRANGRMNGRGAYAGY